jgi:hypothetical protein
MTAIGELCEIFLYKLLTFELNPSIAGHSFGSNQLPPQHATMEMCPAGPIWPDKAAGA